jgi:hypothetical protein
MTTTKTIPPHMSSKARLPARRGEGAPEHIAMIARMCPTTNDGRPISMGRSIISPPSQVPPSICRNGKRSPTRTKVLAHPSEQPPDGLPAGSCFAGSVLTPRERRTSVFRRVASAQTSQCESASAEAGSGESLWQGGKAAGGPKVRRHASPGQRPRFGPAKRPALKGRHRGWGRPIRADRWLGCDPGRCLGLAWGRAFGPSRQFRTLGMYLFDRKASPETGAEVFFTPPPALDTNENLLDPTASSGHRDRNLFGPTASSRHRGRNLFGPTVTSQSRGGNLFRPAACSGSWSGDFFRRTARSGTLIADSSGVFGGSGDLIADSSFRY